MPTADKVRSTVSETYARAVAADETCCGEPAAKGEAAKIAGYTPAELRDLPADAVVNSFGCGNPVAFSLMQPGDVVLDLGSGAGIDLLLAAKKVGPEGLVIGVDMTDEMIERARENAAAAGLSNVEVRKGLIEDLPVEDASVDWVISNCVINLSPEKHRVFSEIARVLKPGGRMRVSDIVAEDLPDWVLENDALYSSCVSGAIPEADYVAGLEAAGLVDVVVEDRLVYGDVEVQVIVESDVEDRGCCGPSREDIDGIGAALAGKVWSVLVTARKP